VENDVYAEEMRRRGRLIARLREERLLTREQLAQEAGLTTSTISHAERGEGQIRFSTLRKLADALGVEPLVLLRPSEAEEGQTAGKGSARQGRRELRDREEAAFVVVGRVVGGETRMTVLWNVPREERDRYRDRLEAMGLRDYDEAELTDEAREALAAVG
jgi:transcriptional regulator with XRE-family HTH domain